jgi:hypothetical protein
MFGLLSLSETHLGGRFGQDAHEAPDDALWHARAVAD